MGDLFGFLVWMGLWNSWFFFFGYFFGDLFFFFVVGEVFWIFFLYWGGLFFFGRGIVIFSDVLVECISYSGV